MAAVNLHEAIDKFLQVRGRQVAEGTLKGERSVVLRFKEYVGGNPRMTFINAEHTEGFFYSGDPKALSATMAESTFNMNVARLRYFLDFCQRRGWLDSNREHPMTEIKLKQKPEKVFRRFSATEMYRFYTLAANPQERILAAMATNTALRIRDITKIRFGQVGDDGEIQPDEPTLDLDQGFMHVKIHKTRRKDTLPITLELDQELRAWLKHYAESIQRPFEPAMYLIPAKRNNAWGSSGVWKLRPFDHISTPDAFYARLCAAAGLPNGRGDGFHTLRRSFARLFYEELKRTGHPDPIRPVMAMLHHQRPEQTYHYIGVDVDRESRNEVLRGQAFLSRLAVDLTNVTPLRRADGGAQLHG